MSRKSKPSARTAANKAAKGTAAASPTKKAVMLLEPNSSPTVVKEVEDYLKSYGFEVEMMESNDENHLKAAESISLGAREKSVCYIAGANAGDDPELVKRTQELVGAICDAGYNTVCPGSTGMMGVLVDEVRKKGKPVTSVFSLDVAHAAIEKLENKFDRIVVAPNEQVRQKLYHLLSGAQIALPGGTGTMTEAAVHFYQNAVMGIIYRRPDSFSEVNFPSPIIYFSPSSEALEAKHKEMIADRFFPGDDAMKEVIKGRDIKTGYWDFMAATYDNIVAGGFMDEKYRNAFIEIMHTPEEVVAQLGDWESPEVRDLMVKNMNIHNTDAVERFKRIMQPPQM